MVKRHFLRHPLIPDENGRNSSFKEIRDESWKEMREYCCKNMFLDALIYLWKEWYDMENCKLWMRAAQEKFICRYRTSMFAESHYRILKRDFFSNFGRPVI